MTYQKVFYATLDGGVFKISRRDWKNFLKHVIRSGEGYDFAPVTFNMKHIGNYVLPRNYDADEAAEELAKLELEDIKRKE